MEVTTTRYGKKAFAWSYSKIKNYETCPKRHYFVDLKKKYREDDADNEQLKHGNLVHDYADKFIKNGTPIPNEYPTLKKWCENFVRPPFTEMHSEQQLAITENYAPTKWFGDDAWCRAKVDAVKINGPYAIVIDWKTGKIIEDHIQLGIAAACVFAHYPNIMAIRSEFVWLKEDAHTKLTIKRSELAEFWSGLMPRIEQYKYAVATEDFPAQAGGLCRNYCPVESCPHHGGS